MPLPLLLLSPDGSRNRAGVVTPTVNGAVSVVAGQFGQAWEMDPGETVSLSGQSFPTATAGTLAVRSYFVGTAAATRYAVLLGSAVSLGQNANGLFRYRVASADRANGGNATSDTNLVQVVTWDGAQGNSYVNGALRESFAYTAGTAATSVTIGTISASDPAVRVESVLIYDVPLTLGQIAVLSQARAWTFDVLADAITPGLLLPV